MLFCCVGCQLKNIGNIGGVFSVLTKNNRLASNALQAVRRVDVCTHDPTIAYATIRFSHGVLQQNSPSTFVHVCILPHTSHLFSRDRRKKSRAKRKVKSFRQSRIG